MVEPRREPRAEYIGTRFQVGLVLFVAGSAVTTALYGGASVEETLLLGLAGGVVGIALLIAMGLQP